MAEQAIAALAAALPAIAADPRDRTARTQALYGAWLCGVCLGAVGMALHHKLCHVLGGTFGLPHAETHTVVLPHAAAYNAAAAPRRWHGLRAHWAAPEAPEAPPRGCTSSPGRSGRALARRPGMPADGLDRAADLAVANPYWNPQPLERGAIRDLLESAFAGTPPA